MDEPVLIRWRSVGRFNRCIRFEAALVIVSEACPFEQRILVMCGLTGVFS